MAKVNKMMPPRNTTIRGQDHLLAYITPEEAQLLMDNGGAGKPGPMGIPAFYSGEDDAFAGEAMSSFESDYGGGGSDDDSPEPVRQSQITGAKPFTHQALLLCLLVQLHRRWGMWVVIVLSGGLTRAQYNDMPF